MSKPKLNIVGKDGNAFSILGKAEKALKRAGKNDEITKFMDEAMSGDYNHLLATVMKYFDVS